jgi:ATPases with chaperone activity, ATP-binding subunit
VRRKPYSVVLLDEIEKAHPDLFNILLQVFEDGHLTDNKGRVVNFKNTIIIMTSNIGSDIIQDNYAGMDERNHDEVLRRTRDQVMDRLKQSVRPEFLNRVDEVIMFEPLGRKEVREIVVLQLNALMAKLAERDMLLTPSEELVEHIAHVGYDPQFGARPIKRMIQKELLNELSRWIIEGKVEAGKPMVIDTFDGQIVFRQPLADEEKVNGVEERKRRKEKV